MNSVRHQVSTGIKYVVQDETKSTGMGKLINNIIWPAFFSVLELFVSVELVAAFDDFNPR